MTRHAPNSSESSNAGPRTARASRRAAAPTSPSTTRSRSAVGRSSSRSRTAPPTSQASRPASASRVVATGSLTGRPRPAARRRRDDRSPERDPVSEAARDEIRERRPDAQQEVRRLDRGRRAEEQPREDGVVDTRRFERAGDEDGGGEHEDHRRVVRHRRQTERLGEELLAETFLVAVDEERDGRERRDDPQERRPVPEQPAADPAREVVDAQERDGAEDENLEDDQRRQHLHVRRPGDPHDRRERVRPQVPELRRRKLQMAEQPALRRQPDLIATLEPHPAVVVGDERERDGRADLQTDQRREHGARTLEEPVDGSPAPAGRARGTSGDRHRRPPSGTRRPCARARRAAVSGLRSRRARVLSHRRRSGVAGRSASSCPR